MLQIGLDRYVDGADVGRAFFSRCPVLDLAMVQTFITTCRGIHLTTQISMVAANRSGLRPDFSVGVDDANSVRRLIVRDPLGRIANFVGQKE